MMKTKKNPKVFKYSKMLSAKLKSIKRVRHNKNHSWLKTTNTFLYEQQTKQLIERLLKLILYLTNNMKRAAGDIFTVGVIIAIKLRFGYSENS